MTAEQSAYVAGSNADVQPQSGRRGFLGVPRLDVALILTVIFLLLYRVEFTRIATLTLIVCTIGLIYRPMLRRWAFWLVITALLTVSLGLDNFLALDYLHLAVLWCLAIFLVLLTPRPDDYLLFNARVLIGLVFLFAVLQKLGSPDYLNSSMFELGVLVDSRFRPIAALFTDANVIDSNFLAVQLARYFNNPNGQVVLESAESLATVARLITWWTLIIEAIIVIMFLWPWRVKSVISRLMQWRDIPLLIFLLTTYPFAQVLPFSWLLTAMGVAQADKAWVRVAYLIVLFIGLFRVATWLSLVESVLSLLPG